MMDRLTIKWTLCNAIFQISTRRNMAMLQLFGDRIKIIYCQVLASDGHGVK